MQELSVSGRGRAEEGWGAGQGSGGAGPALCTDRGGHLFAAGHSWRALVYEFSEMSASASSINFLLLALHPLRKHWGKTLICGFPTRCQTALYLRISHLLIINSPPVLPEASCLPAAAEWQMCQNRTFNMSGSDISSAANALLTNAWRGSTTPNHQLRTCLRGSLSVGAQTYWGVRGQIQEGSWGLKMNTWRAETPLHCPWERSDARWSRRWNDLKRHTGRWIQTDRTLKISTGTSQPGWLGYIL